MYWLGEFYDNVKMGIHGQSSFGFPNHSYNVDFNPDHNFKPDANLPRVDDINLLSSYADKAHLRLMLSYQIYNDSGPQAPYHFVVPARMQSNGVFHSIMHITENGDDKYLKRLGRDPNGAMYKMYTDPSLPANAEKKTRRWEDKSDFTTFVAGILNTIVALLLACGTTFALATSGRIQAGTPAIVLDPRTGRPEATVEPETEDPEEKPTSTPGSTPTPVPEEVRNNTVPFGQSASVGGGLTARVVAVNFDAREVVYI
jgi:hypothetical protein